MWVEIPTSPRCTHTRQMWLHQQEQILLAMGRCPCRDLATLPHAISAVGHGTCSCMSGSQLLPHTLDVSVDLQSAVRKAQFTVQNKRKPEIKNGMQHGRHITEKLCKRNMGWQAATWFHGHHWSQSLPNSWEKIEYIFNRNLNLTMWIRVAKDNHGWREESLLKVCVIERRWKQ